MVTQLLRKCLFSAVAGAFVMSASSARAAVLYNESFDTDGSIADYTGMGELFQGYVQSNDGGQSVTRNGLNLNILPNNDTTSEDGSMYAVIGLGGVRSLLSVQMDFTGITYSSASSAFSLYAGTFDQISEFNPGVNGNGTGRNWARINVAGNNPYTVQMRGNESTGPTMQGSTGTTYTWRVYFNDSGATQTYDAPDGTVHTLNDNSFTMFIGDALVGENVVKGSTAGYASGALEGLALVAGRNFGGASSSTTLDNIIIRDDLALIQTAVPEPASMAVFGVTGLMLMARRRRV
ncbi:MAG TPA: PEP-CTERM sorting domain-containing protein [Tepidisphaeraceae bacterium]|jgi:hypothetical protein|nr:PEP-CTERM sorting domain-containing protein [Tepidisphaeraceae bacterium]